VAEQSPPDAVERSQEPAGDEDAGHPLSTLFGRGQAAREAEDLSGLPVSSLKDALPYLRRPFTVEAVKWKVQAQFNERSCLVVAYIDARLVIERLNLVVAGGWSDAYRALDAKTWQCDLRIWDVVRSDVGQGSGKAGWSDALKRAGVKFGVGVSLYAIPRVHLTTAQNEGRLLKTIGKGEKARLVLTDFGEEKLREGYGKWLEETGVPKFREPLDHGDVFDAVGDVDGGYVPDVPEESAPIAALVEGEEADRLRDRAQELYVGIVEVVGAPAYPPAKFHAGLATHGDSLERLGEFCGQLEQQLADAREARAAS
jgi:hypothetical protein